MDKQTGSMVDTFGSMSSFCGQGSLCMTEFNWLLCSHVMYMSGDKWRQGGIDSTGKDSFSVSQLSCSNVLYRMWVVQDRWKLPNQLCTMVTLAGSILTASLNLTIVISPHVKTQ
jgi:hypothetical protein